MFKKEPYNSFKSFFFYVYFPLEVEGTQTDVYSG